MKTVKHANIVNMIDIFEDEKYYYLVMELLSGGEVSEFLSKRVIAF